MALSDIRTNVADNVNRDDVPNTSGGLIDQAINNTQREICRIYNFEFMETETTSDTVDEQRSYSLPDGSGDALRFKAEINCELINYDDYRIPLTKIHKQDAENKAEYRDTGGMGTPRCYSIQYRQLHLYNKPDHSCNNDEAWTINLEYYGFLAELSDGDDTNDLIDDNPELVEAGATARCFGWAHEDEKKREWRVHFEAMLLTAIREDEVNKYGTIEEGMAPIEGSGAYPQTGSRTIYTQYD